MTAVAKAYSTFLGPYELVDVIEVEGGTTRYLAREERGGQTPRMVELECLSAKYADDSIEAKALCRRARFGELLSHPTIRTVLTYGRVGGRVMAVRENCSGARLSQLFDQAASWGAHPRSGKWVASSVALIAEIAVAIEAVHDARLDAGLGLISPDDILLSDTGEVRYLGIERIGADGVRPVGQNDGAFVAPERRRGDRFDRRADVWSLGACLWSLLVGEVPGRRTIPAPSSKQPAVPPRLDAIVKAALAENPAGRTSSPKTMALELRGLLGALEAEHQRTFSGCDLRALVDTEGPRDSGMSLLSALEADATMPSPSVLEIEAALLEEASEEAEAVSAGSSSWEFFDKTGMGTVDHQAVARKGPVSIPELAATFADDLARARVSSPKPAAETPAAVSVPQPSPWPDLDDDEEPPTTIRAMPDDEEDLLFPPLETFGIKEGADPVGRVPLYSDIRELAPRQEPVVPSDAVELARPPETEGLAPRHAVAELVARIREADPPWLPWAAAAVAVLAVAQGVTWWSLAGAGTAPTATASVAGQESAAALADARAYTKPARAMKMGTFEERQTGEGVSTAAGARAAAEAPGAVPTQERALAAPRAWPRGGADDGARMRSRMEYTGPARRAARPVAPTPAEPRARAAPGRRTPTRVATPAPRAAAARPRRTAAPAPARAEPEESDEEAGAWRDVTSQPSRAPRRERPPAAAAPEEPAEPPEEPSPPVEAEADEPAVGVWRDVTR